MCGRAALPITKRLAVAEVDEIRAAITATHGTRLRYVIWAGMGGSIEDKLMYQAVGLLRLMTLYCSYYNVVSYCPTSLCV